MSEQDYAAPITAAHRYLDAAVIVICVNLNTHLSRKMQAFTTGHPAWLTVIQLTAYAPRPAGGDLLRPPRLIRGDRSGCGSGLR